MSLNWPNFMTTPTLNDKHIYRVEGIIKPGFSEICTDLGIMKPNPFYTEDGRDEGISLHSWLLFLAQGQEPDAEPDPRIAGRVAGIRKFLAESGFQFVGGEESLYEPTLGYCCTPDIWGRLGAFSVVIDAKRGAKLKTHALQTAAQKLALAMIGFRVQKRYSLYLKDGSYKLEEHSDPQDETRWKAIVAAYHAKQTYL